MIHQQRWIRVPLENGNHLEAQRFDFRHIRKRPLHTISGQREQVGTLGRRQLQRIAKSHQRGILRVFTITFNPADMRLIRFAGEREFFLRPWLTRPFRDPAAPIGGNGFSDGHRRSRLKNRSAVGLPAQLSFS